MSDKLSLRKRFPTLWARSALNMLPIANDENMNATTTKKMEEDESEEEDIKFILLEIVFDLCPKMFDRVVAIQLRTILALWPAISSVKLNIQTFQVTIFSL